ncbi:ankyrin [Xylaria arbuscula]|nr:ankyrin [Xylaria arbuscula]
MPPKAIARRANGNPLDPYEARIRELYNRLTHDELKREIDKESGQSIPMSQYRKKFQQLGLRKYHKTGEAEKLSSILEQRYKARLESKVFLWGEEIPAHGVGRMVSRSRPTTWMRLNSDRPPRGYHIRAPTPDQPDDDMVNTPFGELEQALASLIRGFNNLRPSEHAIISPRLLHGQHHVIANPTDFSILQFPANSQPLSSMLTNYPCKIDRFETILPSPNIYCHIPREPISRPEAISASVPIYRQLLFSIANNFAGIDVTMVPRMIDPAQSMSDVILQVLQSMKGSGARSFIENLFKASIEGDHHAILNFILSKRLADIDVNKQKISSNGHAFTPIERALYLEHYETIRVLLHHGADVHLTYAKRYTKSGALLPAMNRLSEHGNRFTILQRLTDAARVISEDIIGELCFKGENDVILYILKEHPKKCELGLKTFFSNLKTRCRATYLENNRIKLSEDALLAAIRLLEIHEAMAWPLWYAAYKGYLQCFEELISGFDFRPDCSILEAAFVGGNATLVDKILRLTDPAVHTGIRGVNFTPLSLAIRKKDRRLVDLVRAHSAFEHLHSGKAFELAWHAAMKYPNNEIIQELLQLIPHLTNRYPEDLLGFSVKTRSNLLAEKMPDLVEVALWVAMEHSNDEIIQKLLQLYPNLADQNPLGLLEFALRTDDDRLVEKMLDRKITVYPDLVENALRKGNAHIVELLLDSVSIECSEGVFETAVLLGNHPVVARLLADGVKPSSSTLCLAIKAGHKNLVELLLDDGLKISSEECDIHTRLKPPGHKCGCTELDAKERSQNYCVECAPSFYGALHAASSVGDNDLTRYLLQRGADPNNSEALVTAYHTNLEVFDTILSAYKSRYARRVTGFGSSLLFSAVKSRDIALITKLLEHNADPHFMELEHQITPFGYCIITDRSEDLFMVKTFLDHGCRPCNVVSEFKIFCESYDLKPYRKPNIKMTAFTTAVAEDNIQLVRFLAQVDESIIHASTRGSFKRTALQQAAEIGSLKLVKLIHNLGADINERPNRIAGATALQLASMGGFGGIVCYLIRHGADVNARGAVINGMTALVGAASQGRIDIVAILLNNGAGRGEDRDEQFNTAMKEAEKYGHYATSDYIRERWSSQESVGPSNQRDAFEEFVNFDEED